MSDNLNFYDIFYKKRFVQILFKLSHSLLDIKRNINGNLGNTEELHKTEYVLFSECAIPALNFIVPTKWCRI